MIISTDLNRLPDALSPAEWQAALTYWQAHGLTDEEARRAEAFARDLITRHTVSLESARAGVLRAMHASAAVTPPAADDPVAKRAKAKTMLYQGLISQAEYRQVKAKILSGM
jgi:hypothetical protein